MNRFVTVVIVLWIGGWVMKHSPAVMGQALAIGTFVIVLGLCFADAKRRSHRAHIDSGTGSRNKGIGYVAHHEIGHAVAFTAGGAPPSRIHIKRNKGHVTVPKAGRLKDRDYAMAVAAGAEAGARYLQIHCGYSRRNAVL